MVVIKLETSLQNGLPDKYTTIKEFFDDIYTYEELIFEYNGQRFVVTYYDDKLSVAESNKPATEQIFASPENFAASFMIDGVRFQDFVTNISVLVR